MKGIHKVLLLKIDQLIKSYKMTALLSMTYLILLNQGLKSFYLDTHKLPIRTSSKRE